MRIIVVIAAILISSVGEAKQNPQNFKIKVKNDVISVSNNGATSDFRADFKVLYTAKDPRMELRSLSDCRYFAPSWIAENLSADKKISHIAKNKAMGGDGIDDSANGSVDSRTFDIFSVGRQFDFVCKSAKTKSDTTYFEYQPSEIGRLECKLYMTEQSAPVMEYRFIPSVDGYFSVAYLGAKSEMLQYVDALWQPMVWQRKIFPAQSYMTLAYTCPIPATLVNVGGTTTGVVATADQMPFQPLPTQYNNRFGVAIRNAEGEVQPMIFAPVLGHVGSKMSKDDNFRFTLALWVEKAPVNIAFQSISRNMYDFKDYRQNAFTTINNTIDNIIDYTLSDYSNFIDSLKGCSYSTDVPGSTKNVSSLNPLSVALLADDKEIYDRRAYPIMEYMLSRENTLFCLDTTQKVQSPSRKMAGPCATLSELAMLSKLSNGNCGVLGQFAETKFYKGKSETERVKYNGGQWYDALEMYRSTGDNGYLASAKRGADAYIANYINKQQTKFINAFFWNRYAPFYVNLLEMYEQTGDKRYLDAAHEGAREYAMFTWMTPMIPDSDVVVNKGGKAPYYWYLKSKGMPQQFVPEESVPAWRLSEIGLVPESSTTCIGHRAVFMAHHAPYMLRIANYTGDKFMYDIARSAIVGRYANFPGYHINTDRTTAYEKEDYPLRKHNQISVNSFHYNHQFPLLSVLYDFAITDVNNKSNGEIAFKGDYIEGYGYLQAKFYGNSSGKFYNRDNVWLWIPRRLLTTSSVELNYIAARGDNELMVALTNQSAERVESTIQFNTKLLPMMSSANFSAELWQDNKKVGDVMISNGKIDVVVTPKGITSLIIKDIAVKTQFQHRMLDRNNSKWANDYYQSEFGHSKAMILNMGADLKTAFVYLQDDDRVFSSVSMSYSIDGRETVTVNKVSFPFEFTVPLAKDSKIIEMKLTGVDRNGRSIKSESFKLSK